MAIRHFLADGTEVESIEGRIIPPTGKTEAVYKLVANLLLNSKPRSADKKPQTRNEKGDENGKFENHRV